MDAARERAITHYLLCFTVLLTISAAAEPGNAAPVDKISWSGYAITLKAYVDDRGLVDYRELRADMHDLDELADSLARLNPTVYEQWSPAEQTAFWINTYNALVLKAVAENYPEHGSVASVGRTPGNGITPQYGRVWDRMKYTVYTLPMTLESIEDDQFGRFKEPRIHLALASGTTSAPPLRREPYSAERLDEQLNDQTRRFLSDPTKFRIDREASKVFLSSIFQWYGTGFVNKYRPAKLIPNKGEVDSSVINFIASYVDSADREYLEKGDYTVNYMSYDWALNEKK